MSVRIESHPAESASSEYAHHMAAEALNDLPDDSAVDLSELADRIGVDKLDLIQWVRADIKFARLVASKMTRRVR